MKALRGYIVGVIVGVSLMAIGSAIASPGDRTPVRRFDATVICAGMAEDSAGHVRLTRFDANPDGTYTLVYHCRRNGY